VGVFQAACLVVLAAYGVGGGPGLAYGILLQAVEVLTALLLGIPALLREGLTWQDIRPTRDAPEDDQQGS
jgi:phosphatidylinositol alpha-mannosyltransferase